MYKQIRQRLTRLTEIRHLIRMDGENPKLLVYAIENLEELCQTWTHLASLANIEFRLKDMAAAQLDEETRKAREWVLGVITLQEQLCERSHFVRLLRSALEKDPGERTDLESLYMTLTEEDPDDPTERLDIAYTLVLHFNYAETYKSILEKAQQLSARKSKASEAHAKKVRKRIVEKAQSIKVDMFACAVPLSTIRSAQNEERDCPVCRNAYLDFATFSAGDLLADYAVRIKYCGHVVGKHCLETWMDTPLIDAARYPDRTCPLCRTEIEGRETPDLPRGLREHIVHSRQAGELMQKTDLETDECLDVLLRLMSEEVAVGALLEEAGEEEHGQVDVEMAREFLKERAEELREEKKMLGFARSEGLWRGMRAEWVDSGVKR